MIAPLGNGINSCGVVLAAAALLAFVGCGSSDNQTSTDTTTTAAATPSPTPPEQAPPNYVVDPRDAVAAFRDAMGGGTIKSMCRGNYSPSNPSLWACYYDRVEGAPAYLRVVLSTPGGLSSSELDQLADRAGMHWFNFIGCDFSDLDTIVVRVNGIDHNYYRRDFPLAANC